MKKFFLGALLVAAALVAPTPTQAQQRTRGTTAYSQPWWMNGVLINPGRTGGGAGTWSDGHRNSLEDLPAYLQADGSVYVTGPDGKELIYVAGSEQEYYDWLNGAATFTR